MTALTEMTQLFGLSFLAFFVALDAIGTLPLFVSLTQSLSRPKRAAMVNSSMLVAFFVAVGFALAGDALFHFLGITLEDFKIAGGLVLLLVALTDLISGPEGINRSSGSTGIVPLAVPLITGPGTLTTLMLQIKSVGYGVSLAALASNYALAWLILRHSERVTRTLGKDGTLIISKIAALLLATLSVSMIRSGVFDAIRTWNH
ncbi:MAG: MarC family protein [Bdellovibrionia bacterium]